MIALDTGLTTCLKANSALMALATNGVHNPVEKAGVLPPLLRFQEISEPWTPVFGSRRAIVTAQYQLTGVAVDAPTKGGKRLSQEIRDAAVTALSSLTVAGYSLEVRPLRNLGSYSEDTGGLLWWFSPVYVQFTLAS